MSVKILVHTDESAKRHETCNGVRKFTWGLNAIHRPLFTWAKDWYLRPSHLNSPELISGQLF